MSSRFRARSWILAGLALLAAACAPAPLRLATTTSTYDTGLLDAILPDFERASGVEVDVVAVGTGQAIEIGKGGDADVLLVHNRKMEEAFVAAGFGVDRIPVMYNDFILVGPADDPARVSGAATASQAMARIAEAQAGFVSRGDDSGTHARERLLWEAAGLSPGAADPWYQSIGQGMGETLRFAEQVRGYTLTDRGTYLGLKPTLPDLFVLFGGDRLEDNPDPALLNPYAVIQVMPRDPQSVEARRAADFVAWLTSLDTQEAILRFGVDRFGQSLFYPSSPAWCDAHGPASPGCVR